MSLKGIPKTEEHKRKISEAQKGKSRLYLIGHKVSDETKEKIRKSNIGKPHLSQRGKIVSEETRKKIGLANKGKKRTDEQKKRIGESGKGRQAWNKGKKCQYVTDRNLTNNPGGKGDKHWNWKGKISLTNSEARRQSSYVLWRKSCLERDNFTCQKTGISGGKLEVHHINSFSEFPELRTSIENGITLSKECHKEFHHIYGRKNNTLEQLQEYLCLNIDH